MHREAGIFLYPGNRGLCLIADLIAQKYLYKRDTEHQAQYHANQNFYDGESRLGFEMRYRFQGCSLT